MFHKLYKHYAAILASFIITAGWGWYHFSHHPRQLFIVKEMVVWCFVWVLYQMGKRALVYGLRQFKRHHFWHETFIGFLDTLFLYFSLLFVIFFFRNELLSLVYVSVVMLALYVRLQRYLGHHPQARPWLTVNKAVFVLAYFLFIIQSILQYTAYHYYILDSNVRFFNIVLFRSVAMTLFWLFGFAVGSSLFVHARGRWRYAVLIVWGFAFVAAMGVWAINIGILYYSGLYLNPVVLEHASGAGQVAANNIAIIVAVGWVGLVAIFITIVRKVFLAQRVVAARYWHLYNCTVGVAAIFAMLALTSFKNTPEFTIIKSFYQYYAGESKQLTLDPVIQKKLERFGIVYDTEQFLLNQRPFVFSPSSTKQFLPSRFTATKPNIVFFLLESYSARLTDVYNTALHNVTPGLDAFAADPHTTIFRNYYNASTPTITGTLSQLCSFLPPTGHGEIENEKKLQSHRLLCLPEVLQKHVGFKYSSYITAVEKDYAHKDGILGSMGVQRILGTDELKKYIAEKPLSWGYSDHQMMPALWQFMQTAPQPFLMMLATVDTHPPFDLAKDAVNYGNGKDPVLNMVHTTDDAFNKFWNQFKSSSFYNNTIIVAIADHAIFPGALGESTAWPKDFPDQKSQHTFYDQNTFLMYVPDGALPKEVTTTASGIDVVPTLLHILNLNIPNSFEGHSLFDDRDKYPNILGMHELGLYINQQLPNGKRDITYDLPTEISCPIHYQPSSTPEFTECDYLQFFNWKRQMFEEGRFWKQ